MTIVPDRVHTGHHTRCRRNGQTVQTNTHRLRAVRPTSPIPITHVRRSTGTTTVLRLHGVPATRQATVPRNITGSVGATTQRPSAAAASDGPGMQQPAREQTQETARAGRTGSVHSTQHHTRSHRHDPRRGSHPCSTRHAHCSSDTWRSNRRGLQATRRTHDGNGSAHRSANAGGGAKHRPSGHAGHSDCNTVSAPAPAAAPPRRARLR